MQCFALIRRSRLSIIRSVYRRRFVIKVNPAVTTDSRTATIPQLSVT